MEVAGRRAQDGERFGYLPSGVATARGRVRLTWDHPASSPADRDTGSGPDRSDTYQWDRWVWVAAADRARVEERRPGDDRPALVVIATPEGYSWWRTGPDGPRHGYQPWGPDGDRWGDPLGDRVADALVYPGWLMDGLTPVARRPSRSATGRAAWELDLLPAPRSSPDVPDAGGGALRVDEPDLVRVTVDRETGAVPGWRSLVRYRTSHRAWWTELALGEAPPDALFDATADPELVPWDGLAAGDVAETVPDEPPGIERVSDQTRQPAGPDC